MSFPLYSTEICPPGYKPNFTAGVAQCVLQSGNVSRSRLVAGGALFRSVETAASSDVNAIALSVTIVYVSGNGTSGNNIYDVVFNYTDTSGVPQTPITVTQRYNNTSGNYSISGIDTLRAALVGNPIVTMPVTDIPSGWTGASDADHISQFGTGSPPEALLLSGGVGMPADDSGIRTGPTFSLFHVAFDDSSEDGAQTEVNAISEWTGTEWVAHPSPLYKLDSYGNITPTPVCP